MSQQMMVSSRRFNRRTRQFLPVVYAICFGITKNYAHSGDLAIIDKFTQSTMHQSS